VAGLMAFYLLSINQINRYVWSFVGSYMSLTDVEHGI